MSELLDSRPPARFWVVAVVALLWNLLGVANYLAAVGADDPTLAIPAWVTGAFAVAVFAGTLGAISLLLRKAWAVPLFAVSLIAVVLQMGYVAFLSDIEVSGAAAWIIPVMTIVVAGYLLWASLGAQKKGWIR